MTDKTDPPERLWEKGWEGHEIAQLKRMAMLSFREKIEWLENAQEMLQRIEPRRREEREEKQ